MFFYLFLIILSVGSFRSVFGMDAKKDGETIISQSTGKQQYSDGWRFIQSPNDQSYCSPLDISNCFLTINPIQIEKNIKKKTLSVNEPLICISDYPSYREYYYPAEWIIRHGKDRSAMRAFDVLLRYGLRVDGYKDYSLLRGVFEELSGNYIDEIYDTNATKKTKNERRQFLLHCLQQLLGSSIDLKRPFPAHNGFSRDDSAFMGCTARQYLDQSISSWKDINLWKQVDQHLKKFDNSPTSSDLTQQSNHQDDRDNLVNADGYDLSKVANEATGKSRYEDGWRGPVNPNDSMYRTHADIDNALTLAMVDNIKKHIDNRRIMVNEPCITFGNTVRDERKFYYPVEYVIFMQNYGLNKAVKLLLDKGAFVDGYKDYSPLRDVLTRLSTIAFNENDLRQEIAVKKEKIAYLLGVLKLLFKYNVDIEKQLPTHNGFGHDDSAFLGCTARQYLDQSKSSWKDIDLWNQVDRLFKDYK